MNLLVTGGAGFVGSNLVRHIINQPGVNRLVNLDGLTYAGHLENLADVQGHPKYVFEHVDLRCKASVAEVVRRHQITHVMHLAAESHVDRSIVGPDDFIHTNVVGTFCLLEACRACWPANSDRGLFLHVSTDEVYGSLGPSGLFTEETPYAPRSPYSASKASSDMLVRAYHHTYRLPVVVTISPNNYGPYQFPEKLIPVVVQKLIRREAIPVYGDGLNVRDWLFVLDHVEALWCVLQRGRPGQTYHIGGNNEWPNLRVVERICDLFDELRPDLGGNSRSLITFVKDRPGHDRRYAIDATKINRELGWKPKYEFAAALRHTVSWYLENKSWLEQITDKRRGTGQAGPPSDKPAASGPSLT